MVLKGFLIFMIFCDILKLKCSNVITCIIIVNYVNDMYYSIELILFEFACYRNFDRFHLMFYL